MGISMKRFLSLIIITNLLCVPAYSLEFDTSIDDSIRKNYNPSKLEEDMTLPNLPKIRDMNDSDNNTKNIQHITPTKKQQPLSNKQKELVQSDTSNYQQQANSSEAYYAMIKKGKRIKVRALNNVSDTFKKGTRVSFVSKYPISATCFTIPAGTIFKGEVVNAHKPQLSGNGGLVEIKISSMVLNHEIQPISGYITKANNKRVFFNNIKGKRKYVTSTFKSTQPGFHFFGKMMRITVNLATDGSSIFVSPFSFVVGVFALAGNVVLAPTLGLFHKGESIQIPAGSAFEIKLDRDIYIYSPL